MCSLCLDSLDDLNRHNRRVDFPTVASSGEVNSPTSRSLSEGKTCE